MAVHSNTFGGLHLTGEDAKKFRNQVNHGRASAKAQKSAVSGIAMAKEFLETGLVIVDKE